MEAASVSPAVVVGGGLSAAEEATNIGGEGS